MSEFKKVGIKNNLLKKMISTLSKENDDLQRENKKLRSEIYVLKEMLKKVFCQRILQRKNNV